MTADIATGAVAEALSKLDIGAQKERVADVDRNLAAVDEALRTGEERVSRLREQLRNRRAAGPDPNAAASALLAGENVLDRAPGPAAISEEIETLLAGLRSLREQRTDLLSARERARLDIAAAIGAAFSPLIDAKVCTVHEHLVALRDLQAEFGALAALTRSPAADAVGKALYSVSGVIEAQRAGLGGPDAGTIDPAIAELISRAQEIGHVAPVPRRQASAVRPPVAMPAGPIRMTTID